MNTIDTNLNYVVKGNVEITVENYDVNQDRYWTKKDKNQSVTSFASPEGKSCIVVNLVCRKQLQRAVLQNTFLKTASW